MAKREHSYVLPHAIDAVRALVTDPRAVGRALAFVEATEGDGGQLRWRLPPAMATITGVQSMHLHFEADGDLVRWAAHSPRLVSRGELRLAPAGPLTTTLDMALEMAGVGAARLVIEPLAGVQIQAQMDSFVDNLEADLQAVAERGVMSDGRR